MLACSTDLLLSSLPSINSQLTFTDYILQVPVRGFILDVKSKMSWDKNKVPGSKLQFTGEY